MKISQVKLICFSPTGTTKTILEGIARGIGVKDVLPIDVTLPLKDREPISTTAHELAILGAPVYGGRLPVEAVNRFKQLKAAQTPAILIVMYGNREFEDALLELKHLAVELGFRPVAGGAFIGEHSFASAALPIANGRPDSRDIQIAVDFGKQIKAKIHGLASPDDPTALDIPGRFPYEASGARAMAVSPVTIEASCTLCGTCADACPTAAISIHSSVATQTEKCLRCCACIKNCPEDARQMADSQWKKIALWLNENCATRKEPQLFGVTL